MSTLEQPASTPRWVIVVRIVSACCCLLVLAITIPNMGTVILPNHQIGYGWRDLLSVFAMVVPLFVIFVGAISSRVVEYVGWALMIGLAWVVFQPSPASPNVSIKLLGYTNDSSGTPLAMITVTNLNAFTIRVYRPTISIKAPTEPGGYTNYFQGGTNQWRQFHSDLSRGMSGNFTIPRPATESPWRLSLLAYNDFTPDQVIKRFLTRRRYMPSEIHGDWIKGDK